MTISVALAAYQGQQFIAEQLDSILPQLGPSDEIIVSDDQPGGATETVVRAYAGRDPRVKYFAGPGDGVIRNFNAAISRCSGDVIFLSDQDDIWLPNKVERVMAAISAGADLVLHDAAVTDKDLHITEPSFFAAHGSKPGYWQNVIRNSYMGCCMAFRASLLPYLIPIPENVPMHDQYIGLQAEKYGKVTFIKEPLILYRVHGGNVTGRATRLSEKIRWRLEILSATRFGKTQKLLVPGLLSRPLIGAEEPQDCAVSACIVTYNNEDKIGDCIGSILEAVKLKNFTLYIVDNGSTDHTCALIKERFSQDSRVVLLETGENNGFGAGHNKVLPLLQSEYHCVINPDVLLKEDVITKMVAYLNNHPDVVQLSPRICFPDGTDQILGKRIPHIPYLFGSHFRKKDAPPNFLLRRYAMLDRGFSAPFAIQNATGCFMIFRTDAFLKVGGFDNRYFMYFEDCDITREMNHLGKVLYYPAATVYHAWERGSMTNPKLRQIHVMSMLKYYIKWYAGPFQRLLTKVLSHFDVTP